jgi:hypothetical protein
MGLVEHQSLLRDILALLALLAVVRHLWTGMSKRGWNGVCVCVGGVKQY